MLIAPSEESFVLTPLKHETLDINIDVEIFQAQSLVLYTSINEYKRWMIWFEYYFHQLYSFLMSSQRLWQGNDFIKLLVVSMVVVYKTLFLVWRMQFSKISPFARSFLKKKRIKHDVRTIFYFQRFRVSPHSIQVTRKYYTLYNSMLWFWILNRANEHYRLRDHRRYRDRVWAAWHWQR